MADAKTPPVGVMIDGEELRRLLAGVGTVGNIDGFNVVRRESVLELVDRRIREAKEAAGG